jgi:hypothetical protein
VSCSISLPGLREYLPEHRGGAYSSASLIQRVSVLYSTFRLLSLGASNCSVRTALPPSTTIGVLDQGQRFGAIGRSCVGFALSLTQNATPCVT